MTRRFRHGLIVGKFYPPHAGHHFLVEQAAASCERVTVIVAASSVETIPLADRVVWMTETHQAQPNVRIVGALDDHPVNYGSAAAWEMHVKVFASAVARAASLDGAAEQVAVDAVFSSERYGEELARRFGATSVCVDLDRRRHPCSSTAVRADVAAHWAHLAPATRAGLALRVVFVGAESTGTTTVSRAVADALDTSWVPEYGRDHTLALLAARQSQAAAVGGLPPSMDDLTWTTEDFVAIAARQVALEDEAAGRGGPVIICDTDAFATAIWHERYMGARSAEVESWADERTHHLYLLTSDDGVPFVQDGIRDGEHLRSWMTARFAEALDATARPWRMLTGTLEERVAASLAAVDDLTRTMTCWRFASPLPDLTEATR